MKSQTQMCYRGIKYDRNSAVFNFDSKLATVRDAQLKFMGQSCQTKTINFVIPGKITRFLGQTQQNPVYRNLGKATV